MHKKIGLTFSAITLLGFSLLALNIGIKKRIGHQVKASVTELDTLKDGDVIFQTSTEGQGLAIQMATKSVYTHVGVIFKTDGQWMVYEAVEPVKKTPYALFVSEGDSSKFVIKRLVQADSLLTMDKIAAMKTYLNAQLNKHYDPYFNWKDDALYCSELVWKCYRKAGIELSSLKALKSYDLSSSVVKAIMKERYGKAIPYEEKVVSPGDIFQSEKLFEVRRN
jgi:uncharacterized protein YycO